MTAYASSKAAISKFHESLTPELDGTGVLSFAVNPGVVATELGKAENVINRSAIEHPAMQAFIGIAQGPRKSQSPECCANLMVTLAADKRCKVLHGHHLNADQELEPVLVEAEKPDKGRIGKERLYLVRLGEL
jgi:NAD(P)-dependent dehydrogenase (short-subunit alcohol dehydrogenase family)